MRNLTNDLQSRVNTYEISFDINKEELNNLENEKESKMMKLREYSDMIKRQEETVTILTKELKAERKETE